MSDTVIVSRKIDDLGRIVIPSELRHLFRIKEGDALSITGEDGTIMIRKLDATCVYCGATENVKAFKGRAICKTCKAAVGKLKIA